ncbi:unnamed protein product [Peniophora sp. CBMAI 1063]|nr:unnamed protein product [Peniophora sp. CBMAI 1063]
MEHEIKPYVQIGNAPSVANAQRHPYDATTPVTVRNDADGGTLLMWELSHLHVAHCRTELICDTPDSGCIIASTPILEKVTYMTRSCMRYSMMSAIDSDVLSLGIAARRVFRPLRIQARARSWS